MAIEITNYTAAHIDQVRRFNQRIRAGGMGSKFPETDTSSWLPPLPGRKLYQEYYVALDDSGTVRGAYILKHQEFWVGGCTFDIGDYQLPISEGPIDPAFTGVATALLFDCQRRLKFLYGLGIGGYDQPAARFLKAGRWRLITLPFQFKVIHPLKFFRQIRVLRTSALRRLALDALAFTGFAGLGIKTLQTFRTRRLAHKGRITVQPVDEFGPWADDLWHAHKNDYKMTAVRDAETLRILYPREKKKFIRVQVFEGSRCLGWAVMLDTLTVDHKHFGSMRLGSFIDAFAAPQDAGKVAGAATAHLVSLGVDLIVTNQSHGAWTAACDAAGYLRGPSNFLLATSPALTKLLVQTQVADDEIYLTRGDGDGPIHL